MTEANPKAYCMYYDGNEHRVKCRALSSSGMSAEGAFLPVGRDDGDADAIRNFFSLDSEDDVMFVLWDDCVFTADGEQTKMEYV